MPYILDPGARLLVGPHGQLDESLGACCAPCARAGTRCDALGASGKAGAPISQESHAVSQIKAANPGMTVRQAQQVYVATRQRGVLATLEAMARNPLVLGGAAAAAILGGALFVSRRRRRRR